MLNRRHLTAALAAFALAVPIVAMAQTTTRIIVPFGAGGPIDVTTRVLAEAVKGSLGTVIIENRAGAGGNIGVSAAAKAAPDGLTLGVATTASHGINPWLFKSLPYDPVKDTTPVTQMLRVPNVLVVNADAAKRLNINTVADLIAYAKANPAKLNYGSGGNGSAGHLAGELFKNQAGVFALHIPYNGGSAAQTALLGGQVDFNFDNLATAAPNIRAGHHRAAQQRDARGADAGRDPARFRDRYLVGPVRARGHAARDGAPAQRRLHPGPEHARGQSPLLHPDG